MFTVFWSKLSFACIGIVSGHLDILFLTRDYVSRDLPKTNSRFRSSIAHIQPLPRAACVRMRRLDQQMLMVVHQHVGVKDNPVLFHQSLQQFDEMLPARSQEKISRRPIPRVVIWYKPPSTLCRICLALILMLRDRPFRCKPVCPYVPIRPRCLLSLCPGTFPLGPEQAFTLPSSLFFFGFEIMIVWSRVDIIREFDKTKTWAFVVFPILKFSDFTKAL